MTTQRSTPEKPEKPARLRNDRPGGEHDDRIQLRLPSHLVDELRREAELGGESLSARARTLILRGLDQSPRPLASDDQEAALEEQIREHELAR